MLSFLVLCIIAAFWSTQALKCTPEENGFNATAKIAHAPIPLTVEWQTFYFTNTNSTAFPTFEFDVVGLPCVVQVADAYCPGDTFGIYWDGAIIPSLTVPPTLVSCAVNNPDPNDTFATLPWSWSIIPVFTLGPAIPIQIVATSSPFTAGAAAVRIQCAV